MRIKKIVGWMCVLCLMCFIFCGCADFMTNFLDPGWKQREAIRQEKIKVYFEQNPQLSDDIKNCILNKNIRIGMTKEQVLLSWGHPCHGYSTCINKSVGLWGVHEQWVYHSPYGPYLYFENGVLTSWQN